MKHAMLFLMFLAIGHGQAYFEEKQIGRQKGIFSDGILNRRSYGADHLSKLDFLSLHRRGAGKCWGKKCPPPPRNSSSQSLKDPAEDAAERKRINRLRIQQARRLQAMPIPDHHLHTVTEEPSRASSQRSPPVPEPQRAQKEPDKMLETPIAPKRPPLARQDTPPPKNKSPSGGSPDSQFMSKPHGRVIPESLNTISPSGIINPLAITQEFHRTAPLAPKPPVPIYHRRHDGSPKAGKVQGGSPKETRPSTGSSPTKGQLSPNASSQLTATALDKTNLKSQSSSGEASDSSSRKVNEWLEKNGPELEQ